MVQSGRYASTSAFLREAIDEKLELLRRERLRSQLARYCDSGYAAEDVGLVAEQALDPDESA